MRKVFTPSTLVPLAIIAAVAAMVAWANIREGRRDERRPASASLARSESGSAASREALEQRIAGLQKQVADNREDMNAVALLAEALIRQSRVSGSAGPVMRAQALLADARRNAPEHYGLMQMQGQLFLAQHKFRDAIAVAEECRRVRPEDSSIYGVLGDAHLELGEYDEAFASFDRMMQLRPGAASYARMSYALELQGDLEGALKSMRLAADATGGADLEGLAWTDAQVGELLLRMHRPSEAMTAFIQASQAFPGHPFAMAGYAKALVAIGRREEALTVLQQLVAASPTPDVHAQLGDLFASLDRRDDATREYALAEAAWRSDAPEPKNLARFLADRDLKIDEAVTIAEQAKTVRNDIFTADALAWAYFKAGRVDDARRLMAEARRTGTRDPEILRHAKAIADAGAGTS